MQKKENNKEIIFREAARLFSEKGFERTSMRMIAEAAGVSKPAIYYYFSNKDSLFEQLLDIAMSHVQDTADTVSNSELNAVEKLELIAVHRFELLNNHPEISRFMFDMATGNMRNRFMKHLEEKNKKYMETLLRIINDGQEQGLIKSGIDPIVATFMLVGGLNVYMMVHIKAGIGELTAEKAREFVTTLLNGIGLSQ